jgi:hypothetical protein
MHGTRLGRSALRALALTLIACVALAAIAGVAVARDDAPATSGAAPAAGIPFSFHAVPYAVRDLPPSQRPFYGSGSLSRVDDGIHDDQGVRMRRVGGVLYDFPRGQATFGLLNLGAYRVTRDDFFLQRALAQARRLVSNRVISGDAWFIPNPNHYYRHGLHNEPLSPPWYSALSQGRVLLFFSRLAQVTGDQTWLDAADHVFAAFLLKGPRSGPYVTMVDNHGYYWLEEWPWAGMRPDHTYNGHNSAAFGIFEYWAVTKDARALELFRGAATTTQHYASTFRQPGWLSHYCLAHRIVNPLYHDIHVHQLLGLYSMTGANAFARDADLWEADYPYPATAGTLRVTPGRYTVVRFGSSGSRTGRRTVTVARALTCAAGGRERFRGGGVYIHATSGPFSGSWIEEAPGHVYLRGAVVPLDYDPARPLTLAAGRAYSALLLGDAGGVIARSTLPAGATATLLVNRGAVVNGWPSVRVAAGALKGYWIRLQKGVKLR